MSNQAGDSFTVAISTLFVDELGMLRFKSEHGHCAPVIGLAVVNAAYGVQDYLDQLPNYLRVKSIKQNRVCFDICCKYIEFVGGHV